MQRLQRLVLALAIASSGCSSDSRARNTAVTGVASTGGATFAAGGAAGDVNSVGSGGVPSMVMTASGGATTGSSSSAGGTSSSAGGANTPAAGGGAVDSTGGSTNASGGSAGTQGSAGASGASSGGRSGATGTFPNLAVFGNTTTLELAPVLLAAKSVYPGKATVTNGGIPNLWSGADLATNAETQALVQSVSHSDLRIIFTVCEGIYRIVARRSAGISTLADLRGKRIATTPGTSSAYFLHAMLATVQLDETSVTVVPAALPSQIPTELSSRQVDAATIWEPEIQNASDALGGDAIEFQDKSVYRELFDLHTTAEKLADPGTRSGIVQFLRALVTASDDITAQPSSVWPLVASTTGYDATLISKSWKNESFPGGLVPDLLDVLEQEEAWLAKNAGRAARPRATLSALVDDSPLKEAMAMP
ncbi:MAG TPA: ABC transporter substrate-binding protein [Polyangiaceae bacterium]|nr:ABC transporter substrate-binding protein [Polyangiaceae bacterium]